MILKDPDFKKFFKHIKAEYTLENKIIAKSFPDFLKELEVFINLVERDIQTNLTNIDLYMRDLKRHALNEYASLQ